MELKEGMYVRTKDGEIHKCLQIYIDNNNPTLSRFMNEWGNMIVFDEIKGMPSFEVIDLIEENDYVNGYKVDFVQDGYVVFNHNHPYRLNIYSKDIKSIVTKEQFESMSYKVGE